MLTISKIWAHISCSISTMSKKSIWVMLKKSKAFSKQLSNWLIATFVTKELKYSLTDKYLLFSYWVNLIWVSTHGPLRNVQLLTSTIVVKTVALIAELLKNSSAMLSAGNVAHPTLLWTVVLKLSLLLMITLIRQIFSKA